ncbi:olfactory receptor 226-like [Ambystoma mexicanum]|uniref:olfactory receptor 226-like n=1 Tax=Ambystoma mexicanum TaxID=8296 RepID=UPI0037E8979B
MERRHAHESNVTEFVLLGFPTSPGFQYVLFFFFLVAYLVTLVENLIIIIVIRLNAGLQRPMYHFLASLSVLEICYVTVTIPNLLANFLREDKTITFRSCMAQLYIFISLACTECILLAVMAFDRCVAICNPLRYPSIMSITLCLRLSAGSFIGGFSIALIKVAFISSLTFCGPNVLNHFFCDISPILNLSCTDMSVAELVDFILAIAVILIPLLLIIISYFMIIIAVLRIPEPGGRWKAFSTCASHLTVVIIFYATTLFIYARPRKLSSSESGKLVCVLYSVITPLLNPLIYCLRNNEMKQALKKTKQMTGAEGF